MRRVCAARLALLTAGWLLVSCSEAPAAQRRPRGLLPDEASSRTAPVAAQAPAPEPSTPPPPSSLPSPFMRSAPNPGALSAPDAGVSAAATASAEAVDAAPPRDLSSELRALVGQPASCLDLDVIEAAGGRATVSITANVVPSGRITRSTVSVPGQPVAAVRCLEQRVGSGSLKGPVPGAPLVVSTSIPVEVVSTTGR